MTGARIPSVTTVPCLVILTPWTLITLAVLFVFILAVAHFDRADW
jgi:hypothetical protein